MSDLKPITRALLARARGADDPSREDTERNRGALTRRLGLATLASAASAKATATSLVGQIATSKISALVLSAVIGTTATGVIWSRAAGDPARRAPNIADHAPVGNVAHPSPHPEPVTAPMATASETPSPMISARRSPDEHPLSRTPDRRTTRGSPPSLGDEVEIISAAQEQLNRGEAAAALAALALHARRFPTGILREEREASRVIALCRLGRITEAGIVADRFIARAPASPLVERVRGACK